MKKPLRIKTISVEFEFDRRYVEECNPFASNDLIHAFENLQTECSSGKMDCDPNCLFLFGTWYAGKEVRIGQYGCAAALITFVNVWNEKADWCQDRAMRANKILKKCPEKFIRDFAIGTVRIIDAIKNNERLREAKFQVFFRISYTGTGAHSHDSTGLAYDSTEGFVCWE